ncbi:hypothetical protein [Amycolatopsis panacis]|nr:hypothetical protein [Amycolatopsis panacis]
MSRVVVCSAAIGVMVRSSADCSQCTWEEPSRPGGSAVIDISISADEPGG